MRSSRPLTVAITSCVIVCATQTQAAVDFRREVRPILAEFCFKCHGFDDSARQAGLRLDTAEGAIKGGEFGPVIAAGKPEASEFIKRLTTSDAEKRMPPEETGKHLKPEQIETLRKWIAEGAAYSKHWSFEKPVQSPRPNVNRPELLRAEFDAFVLASLEKSGLSFAPEADRATLARRLALDVIGLPPDEKILAAFLSDSSEAAYENYVDALLASPHYGERWTRHWLDLGRYADTKGYEKDLARQMWPWRDWVIAAFNADMPYDQFTREQLAGDLLPNATREQQIATAFHRNTMANDEGGTDDEEFRVAAVKDRVDTTMQAWMGLTMGCAKCHSHKYDPLSITDYYSFYAFFNQTEDADRYDDSPKLAVPTAEEERRITDLKSQVAAAESKLKTPTPELEAAFPAWEADARSALHWQVIRPTTFLAASGAPLAFKDDNSLIAKGTAPKFETYILQFPATVKRLTALRLEAIPDPAHSKGSVGRAPDGNFVLTSLRLSLRTPDGKTSEIPFASATADFSQSGFAVESVLKNRDDKKGWAVAPQFKERHQAIFSPAAPVDIPDKSELTLTLSHEYDESGATYVLGRFRIAFNEHDSPALAASLPENILTLLRVSANQRSSDQTRILMEHFASVSPLTKPLRDELASLKEKLAAIKPVEIPIYRELATAKQRTTKIQNRGNFLDPGQEVHTATPASLHPFPAGAPANRLGVAQWLTSRDNPLTARVAVNRVWSHLFGRGLVETEEDFGASGMAPTHPEVLDFLAVKCMDDGWSFKRLIKTIVMSRTYRQSSRSTPELIALDRDNKHLARGPRFRLESEMVRDQALAVAGLLSEKIGGPSVMPWQPEGLWKSTYNNTKWVTSAGEDRWRRGIYTFAKRTTPYPQMLTFDGPSRETCVIRRIRTNTPLQALTTLNDPVFVEAAQSLARKMSASGSNIEACIATGFSRALLRQARPEELAPLVALYRDRLADFKTDAVAAKSFATEPLGPLPPDADLPRLAALTAVANVILNLDEFLTKP